MKIIVGLGNPGKEYENSRHNVGFMLLDVIAEENGLEWEFDKKTNSLKVLYEDMLFVKPQTFMNNSGDCVSKTLSYYKLNEDSLLVIHDDVDLQFGQTKLQKNIGAAGHHGVESIIERLGTNNFERFRVGIGKPAEFGTPEMPVDRWVLQDFTPQQLAEVKNIRLPIS